MINTTKINENVYILRDRFGCGAILVVGKEKALLYDAGCGADDMKNAVKKVTDLPLVVVLSHGHFDHIGGSIQFEKSYLSAGDRCIMDDYDEALLNKWIRQLAECENKSCGREDGAPEEIYFGADGFKQIKDLDFEEVDLGGLKGEIVKLPGHSLGSVGVLFKDLQLLLSGDALEPVMCLIFANHGDMTMMDETLSYVYELPFENYLTSHSDKLFSKEYILKMRECIDSSKKRRFVEYEYPRPPFSKGWFYVYSLEDEPVGIIISEEENRKRLEK